MEWPERSCLLLYVSARIHYNIRQPNPYSLAESEKQRKKFSLAEKFFSRFTRQPRYHCIYTHTHTHTQVHNLFLNEFSSDCVLALSLPISSILAVFKVIQQLLASSYRVTIYLMALSAVGDNQRRLNLRTAFYINRKVSQCVECYHTTHFHVSVVPLSLPYACSEWTLEGSIEQLRPPT